MAAVRKINDVRVTMRLRSLEELLLLQPLLGLTGSTLQINPITTPKFASGVFKYFRFRLRAQYYCLSGPEGSALAAKEQVPLYNDWQHLRSLKIIKCTPNGQLTKVCLRSCLPAHTPACFPPDPHPHPPFTHPYINSRLAGGQATRCRSGGGRAARVPAAEAAAARYVHVRRCSGD
jgi:hypothetical protein